MPCKVLASLAGERPAPHVWKPVERAQFKTVRAAAAPEESAERVCQLESRLAEVEEQARRREEQAYENGFRKGMEKGEQQAAAKIEPVIARLAKTVEALSGERRRLRREAEEDVVKLALAIGRRVLHRELGIDPEALLGVVNAALKKLDSREVDRVRVHPADAPVLKRHIEQLGLTGKVEVAGDAGLERGAVIFETARGCLDASIETQLQEIARGLSDRLGH